MPDVVRLVWFGGIAPKGAPRVEVSTPADAVVSLETMVLLIRFTTNESCSDTPPPSQPATLLAMMLFVTVTAFHRAEVLGKRDTSVPFTAWKRRPPPLPLSAALPISRLALITSPGPVPSLSPGAQSASAAVLPHSTPEAVKPSGAAPMTIRPPPLVGMVGLVLWLKMIVLCSISPFQMNPM